MALLTMGALDNIPPVMRRYEEIVLKQKSKPRYHESFLFTDSFLGAPVSNGLNFAGVTYHMRPAPDYVPIWELEHIMKREFNCTFNFPFLERIESKIGDLRRHGTLMNCHEIAYFPMLYDRYSFPTELAKYLWLYRCTRAKPEVAYLEQFKKCFLAAIHKFKASHKKIIINNLMINDSLYCLNWFDHQSKLRIIRILTSVLREQNFVHWISAENTLLLLEDGLRLLLAISITCGCSLKKLHLWYFFCDKALPITSKKEKSLDDPFISYKTDIDDKIISYMFFSLVMRGNYSIPHLMKSLVLHVAFHCLEYLQILSVEYRYLAGGQDTESLYIILSWRSVRKSSTAEASQYHTRQPLAYIRAATKPRHVFIVGGRATRESLLYLGCLRNGTIRVLNILYTHNDYSEITKRVICHNAWKKAYKLCPCLRVNFFALQVKSFKSVIPVLVMCMPVEGFYTSTGLKSDDAPLLFSRVATTLITNFNKFLRKINLHLNHPILPVDSVIAKLLTELPFLEEFTYRGPLENITSLHTILDYIENNCLRIKKFQLYLTEDPCNPEPYIKAMSEMYNQYEPVFVEKGIYFKLETCQC